MKPFFSQFSLSHSLYQVQYSVLFYQSICHMLSYLYSVWVQIILSWFFNLYSHCFSSSVWNHWFEIPAKSEWVHTSIKWVFFILWQKNNGLSVDRYLNYNTFRFLYQNHFYFVLLGELLKDINPEMAIYQLNKALRLTKNQSEMQVIQGKIDEIYCKRSNDTSRIGCDWICKAKRVVDNFRYCWGFDNPGWSGKSIPKTQRV